MTAAVCTVLLAHSRDSEHVSGTSDSSRPGAQESLQRCGRLAEAQPSDFHSGRVMR